MITDETLAALLDAHAPMTPCALVPEISAWQALDEVPLWEALEAALGARVNAPFFCVAWPGAQALARAVLDGAVDVRGRVVADVGCGSGVAAVACMLRGAARVLAVDVDLLAVQAARVLGERHGVIIDAVVGDPLANEALVDDADVVLAGDLVYSATQATAFRTRVASWGRRARVILADSGRPFFDACGLALSGTHEVAVSPGVDGRTTRTVRLWS